MAAKRRIETGLTIDHDYEAWITGFHHIWKLLKFFSDSFPCRMFQKLLEVCSRLPVDLTSVMFVLHNLVCFDKLEVMIEGDVCVVIKSTGAPSCN